MILKPTFDVEVAEPEIFNPDTVVVPKPVFEIVRKLRVEEPTTNANVVDERFDVSTARRAHGVVLPIPTAVRCTPPAPSDSPKRVRSASPSRFALKLFTTPLLDDAVTGISVQVTMPESASKLMLPRARFWIEVMPDE